MNAITVDRQGIPVAANVGLRSDMPDPVAAPGECVVRTEASALNHLDLWVGRGLPGLDTVYPHIGGSDGAGLVESVGDGVDEAWIGTRVLLNAAVPQAEARRPGVAPAPPDIRMIGEHDHGAHAERFTAPVTNLVPIGDTDPIEAATIDRLLSIACLAPSVGHSQPWRFVKVMDAQRRAEISSLPLAVL